MKSSRSDVVIIGAGVAGLAAAARLSAAGMRTLLLEARDRIGGRVLTVRPRNLESAVELGAEFVHGRSPESFELIRKAGLVAQLASGEPFCSNEQSVGRCDFWGRIEKVLDMMKIRASPEQSFSLFLKDLSDPEITEEDKRAACKYVRGFHAAHPEEISVQSLIEGIEAEEKIDGDKAFRLPGGYDRLVAQLHSDAYREGAVLQLDTAVTRIGWKRAKVEVQARHADGSTASFSAPRLLCTLPLGLLATSAARTNCVQFDPLLTKKARALAKLRVGHVIRVTMVFRRRFWAEMKGEGRSLAHMSFLFSNDPSFPTWWTLFPNESPVLTAWAPADCAERLSELSDSGICDEAVKALARVFHIPVSRCREELIEAFTHNWQKDPYSRGAYSYVAVGGSDAQRELAAPIDETLFFAGEATNYEGHHGTVHGAIASGYRAAEEILDTIRQKPTPKARAD